MSAKKGLCLDLGGPVSIQMRDAPVHQGAFDDHPADFTRRDYEKAIIENGEVMTVAGVNRSNAVFAVKLMNGIEGLSRRHFPARAP